MVGALVFVLSGPNTDEAARQKSLSALGSDAAVSPLDQLSSADIAVHLSRVAQFEEAVSVTNQADSVNAELVFTPTDDEVVAKPQVIATALKSRKDIQKYTSQSGDTISGLAAKFGVTSDSIRWSNNLTSENIPAGRELWIPPVNGIVYVVKSGDTPDSLAQQYRANRDLIIAFNDAEVSGLPVGERILIPDGVKSAPRSTSGFAFGISAIYGYNGYDYGFCTWWVAKRRADIGRPLPANLGNACTWASRAAAAGIGVGDVPAAGAAIMTKGGCLGHVGFVEEVLPDGSIWVSDMNSRGQVSKDNPAPAGGWGRVSWRHVMPGQFGRFKFIY